jgi:hypothetical protein
MRKFFRAWQFELLLLTGALSLFLTGCNGGSSDKPKPTPTPVVEQLLDTTPRGIAMLHLMVGGKKDAWQANGSQILEILLEAKIKNVAFSVLGGGGFGEDVGRLNHLVHELGKRGRVPHLVFYATNGPSQRAYASTPVNGLGTKISPVEWRRRVTSDQAVRKAIVDQVLKYSTVFRSVVDTFSGRVILVGALEDNLDDPSAFAMHDLMLDAHSRIGAQNPGRIDIARNPCPGCYAGSSDTLPAGAFREYHAHAAAISGDKIKVITNDGAEWLTAGTTTYPRQISLGGLDTLRQLSKQNNAWWIVWSAKAQGLSSVTPDPHSRDYAAYTQADKKWLVGHLQFPG